MPDVWALGPRQEDKEVKQIYSKDYLGVGEGWRKLVEPLIERCNAEGVHIAQIKEKFGTLRFYTIGRPSEELKDAIDKAEVLSAVTCEACGEPGGINNTHGWLLTLCPKHEAERAAELAARLAK